MSAIGGKADFTVCENPLSRSLSGVKRTWGFALHMSASDPKQTWRLHREMPVLLNSGRFHALRFR
jgi:hypothetical protein